MESPAGPKLFDLSGKVAIVTGGSRGLGLEMAIGLGQAGAAVVISGRRPEWLEAAGRMLADEGVQAHAVVADATTPDGAEAMLAGALQAFGRVDILVNNAGVTWGAPTLEMSLERWRQVLDTNATSTFVMSQVVGRYLVERGQGGRVINIASVYGLVGAAPHILSALGYVASKGAIVAMTRDLAVKWAPHNILVNAIAPSYFPTRMTGSVLDQHATEIVAGLPIGRLPEAWEIRGLAVFLASPASSYVTGQIIAVDGGLTAG